MPYHRPRYDWGWSWVVLVSSFLCNLIIDGIVYSYGVVMLELLDHFGVGRGPTAWSGSLCNGIQGLVGPFSSIIINTMGCRWAMIGGASLATLGILVSPFAPSIWVFSLTFGVITGAGFGLMHLCPYVIISKYFKRYRSLATGIATCGSGVGTFLFPAITPHLINAFSWRGTMWILGGVVLNGLVIGATYIPPGRDIGEGVDSKKVARPRRRILEWRVLQRPSQLMHMCATYCAMTGFFIMYMFLPDYASEYNITKEWGGFLVAISGISSTCTRVIVGIVSDLKHVDPLRVYNCILVFGACVAVLLNWVHSYNVMAACAAGIGASMGAMVTLMPLLVMDIEGLTVLSDCFGFLSIMAGLAALTGAPFAGVLHDATGSHTFAFCVAGGLMATAGIITIPMRWLKDHRISYFCCKVIDRDNETDSTQNFAKVDVETGSAPQEVTSNGKDVTSINGNIVCRRSSSIDKHDMSSVT